MKASNSIRKQIAIGAILILPFIILYIISKFFIGHLYLFEWTVRHKYLYVWVLVLLFILLKKYIIATSISVGNLIGVLIGQFLGDYIRSENVKRITDTMTNEQTYHLRHHPGFEIWVLSILISVSIAFVVHILLKSAINYKNHKLS